MVFRKRSKNEDVPEVMQDTDRVILINVSPLKQVLRAWPDRAGGRRFEVPQFAGILANTYWQKGLIEPAVAADGSQDPIHPWVLLQWAELGLDLAAGDVPIPPAKLDSDGKVTDAYKFWHQQVSRMPVDLDKVAALFDEDDPAKDWNPCIHPRGVPTIIARQAQFWINTYDTTGKEWIPDYVTMLENKEVTVGRGNKGDDDKQRSYVNDVESVSSYALNRVAFLDDLIEKGSGLGKKRRPLLAGSRIKSV